MLFARSQLALLVASLVSCACGSASRNGPAFEPLPAPKSHYDSETAQVFVKDARKGVSSQRTFDTPFFSFPGDGETKALSPSSESHAAMAALLRRAVPRLGSDQLYFEVHVQRADAGWAAHWFSEDAQANVDLRICAIDGTDQSVLFAGSSRSSAEASSADITDGEPAQLLDAALLNAWGRWLQNDRVIAAVNQALAEKRRWGKLLHPVSCQP